MASFQNTQVPVDAKPLGYRYLIDAFDLRVFPHFVETRVGSGSVQREFYFPRKTVIVLPKGRGIRDNWVDHLEFALRREGVHLELLAKLFVQVDPSELVERLRSTPGAQQLRRAWFLYEELTGETLPLADLTTYNYVNLLDPKIYYTSKRRQYSRQRINLNLLGDLRFCAIVRRTSKLREFEEKRLEDKVREEIAVFPPDVFRRTLNYLYRKETKSSYEIEHESPDQQRAARFVNLLNLVNVRDYLTKDALVRLQRDIVDPRFANDGYRDSIREQIWVGATAQMQEIIHFIGPKPGDVAELMEGFLNAARELRDSEEVPAVIAAAVVAYAFVFIHPFSDGNGRIHRFLIHHILARRDFSPDKVILPISAVMVSRQDEYDRSLESFSVPLLPLIEFELDIDHHMTVTNDTADLYRWIDYTTICEIVFAFLEETVEKELPDGLNFLVNYDKARKGMREIVDLPDRLADLFVSLVVQNQGRLSKNKRRASFRQLTEEEITRLEAAVCEAFGFE